MDPNIMKIMNKEDVDKLNTSLEKQKAQKGNKEYSQHVDDVITYSGDSIPGYDPTKRKSNEKVKSADKKEKPKTKAEVDDNKRVEAATPERAETEEYSYDDDFDKNFV